MAGYPRIGASPDGGITWTLPQLIGYEQAMRFLIENRTITAERRYQTSGVPFRARSPEKQFGLLWKSANLPSRDVSNISRRLIECKTTGAAPEQATVVDMGNSN